MAKYEKPMVIANDELAEGVFAASGCYVVTVEKKQTKGEGRQDLRFTVHATHDASHTCSEQYLTISFTKPVEYRSCNGTIVSPADGSASSTLVIKFNYWNNPSDNIGMGDVVVFGDEDTDYTSASMTDNGKE